jgi:tRNA dimethylallyltransferase
MAIVTQLQKLFTKKPKIIVVLGATSTGKSDLAVRIAQHHGCEIISADSRQVYRGMDLGSGKITLKEMQGIPHHLLDVADPLHRFSAYDFKEQGEKAIHDILERKKTPIICGGTGFYIDTLVSGISLAQVPQNVPLRNSLESKDISTLQNLFKEKASEKEYQSIDIHNKVRIVRALEIIDSIGYLPHPRIKKKYNVLSIGLDIPNDTLHTMIYQRIQNRIDKGMIREVQTLLEHGISQERLYELGLEYRHIGLYLSHQVSYEDMIEHLFADTKRFVKRQRTWFKRNKHIHWFNPLLPGDIKTMDNLVQKFLNTKNR